MENKSINTIAYIDSQNLNLGIRDLGWKLDFKKFRIYLKDKYHVSTAYIFIGYIPENEKLYTALKQDGYVLKFKPVLKNKDGSHKGNVDADLVLQTMVDYYEKNFDTAVIITGDGDFYCLIKYLYERQKLRTVLSPNDKQCSILLKQTAREKLIFMNNLQSKLEYKRKSTA